MQCETNIVIELNYSCLSKLHLSNKNRERRSFLDLQLNAYDFSKNERSTFHVYSISNAEHLIKLNVALNYALLSFLTPCGQTPAKKRTN